MEVALLFACLLWAILAPNPSYWLRRYFGAQLVYLPGVWIAYFLTGGLGPVYLLFYGAFTCAILVIVLRMAFDSLRQPIWGTLALSGALTTVTAVLAVLDAPETGWVAIQLIEALVLVFAATVMGFSVPQESNRTVPLSLCFLWFCQAGMRLGFVMNSSETVWLHANRWFPPTVACIGIAWLGVALRRESNWDGVT